MIAPGMGLRILVATQPVDFRRGMDSLAVLVSEALRDDPFCGALFVFRSKRADRIKILAWDGTGLCLYSNYLASYCISFGVSCLFWWSAAARSASRFHRLLCFAGVFMSGAS